jgi:hypothetical protein
VTLVEQVALAIHGVVCAEGPCVPGTDWVHAAQVALTDLETQAAAR